MTSPTGNRQHRGDSITPAGGFTLIELVFVMALLVIVLSLAAPSLGRFFRGRNLESEARRFLALTRHAQTLAVAEGMPYLLWVNPEQRTYGLRAETTFDDEDQLERHEPLTCQLARDLQLEVEFQIPGLTPPLTNTLLAAGGMLESPWKASLLLVGNLPTIRFTPDGFTSITSPEAVGFREGEVQPAREDPILWVGLNRTRLYYEIWTNPPAILRR
ncbi:MAG: prepilin-type N-terminal cleavage/methylation domain-containing protein [Verrucomicrobia bacterium]|nr:prepilin-type N-terminal cleavage/methylation domain-containing protein [Verrucomicrobiota bacterium]